ncbi:MAG: ATP-grasp domain-containing protein [Pseudomonadaceae bacterium]|nr:ATP-grasp domain-containing protein [Pseudomonadaceae bacterium]
MQVLYPSDYFKSSTVDEQYAPEAKAFRARGVSVATLKQDMDISTSALVGIEAGEEVIYRGWMLSEAEYSKLQEAIIDSGGRMFTDLSSYLLTHHIPNWYPNLSEYTSETVFFPKNADLERELSSLDWDGYFIKDYVKSLKTSIGSVVTDLSDLPKVVSEMEKYRGSIEGGFSVRKLEDFDSSTEQRYFVINGEAHSASGDPVPPIVSVCASRISSRFFSIDVIARSDGELRVVEIGDGQVSDSVGWDPERLVEVIASGA